MVTVRQCRRIKTLVIHILVQKRAEVFHLLVSEGVAKNSCFVAKINGKLKSNLTLTNAAFSISDWQSLQTLKGALWLIYES